MNRKIIHIDMDCFYAAIEVRDDPKLSHLPVAVGGNSERGVLCTCNYIARKFGVSSAMSTKVAKNKCPELIILPVNMSKYKHTAKIIQGILKKFTSLVEPLALDEAYLDVSTNPLYNNSATLIAQEIKHQIYTTTGLTASAGVAPNKFLAKIASGWHKPNGLFVIAPTQVNEFVARLKVEKIFGVGKVTQAKLHQMKINTCLDLQSYSLESLVSKFGKFGYTLYNQARGIDSREVQPDRPRKSLSVETTFTQDIFHKDEIKIKLSNLYGQLTLRLADLDPKYKIKSQFIKIKFNNFKQRTIEAKSNNVTQEVYLHLIGNAELKQPIRLLGLGVNLACNENSDLSQPELFQLDH